MSNVLLLDCTLRDGGYQNDWAFGRDTLTAVFERAVESGIDFLELGFLDQRRPFDPDRSIMPDTASMRRVYGRLDRKGTKLVGMIDFGTCDLDHIESRADSFLDGIRVIFKKHLRKEALDFCRALKEKGYLVFAQLVSITSYSDDELLDLIRLVNDVKPYAVSIVDTYGLLHKANLFHFYEMLDRHVDPSVTIGYHSHNNFQLAYANSIELINRHATRARSLLCDGSLFGMGKGAGNAPTELLCSYLNANFGKDYQVSQLLEAIDSNILDLYGKYHWGYSLKAFLAASNDCHPNYVSYLADKKTLSIKSVNEILQGLEGDKKLLYDKSYIERRYVDYQSKSCNDVAAYRALADLLGGRNLLVLGPGKTLRLEADRIIRHINTAHPFVIAINNLPLAFPVDALFITNSKRYNQQITAIIASADRVKLIATSNLMRANGTFDFTLDYESLIDRDAVFADNSLIMLLKVLLKVNPKNVALAGFDGYGENGDNYYTSKLEYDFVRRLGSEINAYVNKILPEIRKSLRVEFLTSTVYGKEIS